MAIPQELQLVLVTPEKTLLDRPVSALRFPLYDGQIGILPGRAPLVGRLGFGELRITNIDGTEETFFIDGGFVQIRGRVVSLLTDRALPRTKIDVPTVERELQEILARVPTTEVDFEKKQKDQERARKLLAMAKS